MTDTLPLVGVIMGSDSDLPVMQGAVDILEEFGVAHEVRIVSAHRTPDVMWDYAKQAAETDPAKRQAIVWEMQEILYRDRPYIFIAQTQFVRAYQPGWGGISQPYLVYVSKIPWDTIHRTEG